MRSIALPLIVLLWTGPAVATGGFIGLYSDAAYTNCNLVEQVLTINTVYVVHTLAVDGNTAQFKIEDHWGVTRGPVDYGNNLYLGDIYTGVVVTYVGCKALPYRLATLTFIPLEETAPCAALRVVADPAVASGEVEVVDCGSNVQVAMGGVLCVNQPGCCTILSSASVSIQGDCYPVGLEPSTWGSIKALYR